MKKIKRKNEGDLKNEDDIKTEDSIRLKIFMGEVSLQKCFPTVEVFSALLYI